MNNSEIKEYLEKGYIRVKVMFEIIGNPKEHIEKAIVLVKERIEKEDGVVLINAEVGDTEDTGEGLWGTFCDSELLVKDFYKLSFIAFNFMPASIDIIAPSKFEFKDKDMTEFFGDTLALLHETNARHVEANSKVTGLNKNFSALLQNSILLVLEGKSLSGEKVGEPLGLPTEYVVPFLEELVKKGLVTKDKGFYSKA